MTDRDFHMATDAEIRAVLAQARRLRAEAMKDMARTVGQWLTRPRFGVRPA